MRFIPQPAARLSVAVVLVGAGVACQFTGCGPLPGAYGPADRIVPVFFATDRARVAYEPLAYGPTRSFPESLHLGRIDVRIPERHKIGEVERPTVRTLYVEDEKSHLVIRAATEQTYEEFYADLNRRMNRSQRREAFIFIHGYNVRFQDAVFRTAQIAWDLSFEGAAILYSWPSVGELKGYPDDSNNNEWTIPHLQYFLEDVVHHTGASTIHLIAHSLGNRALTYALNRIVDARRIQANRFDQIILAAPDIDASTFRSLAKAVAQNAHRTTIYASSGDLALKASAQYQGAGGEYRRAGDTTPEVLTVPEIDTLDASLVDTSLLGHSYYGNNRSILTDIHELFAQNAPPPNRFGIESVGKPPRQYWRMLK
jgi:esterase/lipase superfamily enzyme